MITNQGGIERGFVNQRNFNYKMEYIIRSIREYTSILNVQYDFCPFNDPANPYRKPNVGMLDNMMRKDVLIIDKVEKEDCLMIGDASGKKVNSPIPINEQPRTME